MAKVQVLNEQQQPLSNVTVAAFKSGSSNIVARATTNTSGVASFPTLDANDHSFRPLITRHSGKVGDMANSGSVHISVLSDSAEKKLTPPKLKTIIHSRVGLETLEEGSGGEEFELDFGIIRWNEEGVLEYWDSTAWAEWGPVLPQSDPGGGAVWLSEE